jgi:hypothetical protein
MNDLNFDIGKLASPKTQNDFIALLDEALSVADDVQICLDALYDKACENKLVQVA